MSEASPSHICLINSFTYVQVNYAIHVPHMQGVMHGTCFGAECEFVTSTMVEDQKTTLEVKVHY